MANIAINVEGISKKYSIGKEKIFSFRESINSKIARISKINSLQNAMDFWALKDVSFKVNEGSIVGIIGRNGAGKSTLLKIISGITKPTNGRIELYGRVASLLEVGTGFHPELTGRENIFLNGTILGMSRFEVTQKFDEIVEFSGIEKFIDTPVKRYSSGMSVRLAFAVAAHLEPEILIIDEVLAVGDAEFQKKCMGKMNEVSRSGRTVLFVSHNISAVLQLCDKGILLQDGKIKTSGGIEEVVAEYQNQIAVHSFFEDREVKENMVCCIRILESKTQFYTHEPIRLSIEIKEPINKKYTLLISILDTSGVVISSSIMKIEKPVYEFGIPHSFLARGTYVIQMVVYIPAAEVLQRIEQACTFEVIDSGTEFVSINEYNYGKVFGNYSWS